MGRFGYTCWGYAFSLLATVLTRTAVAQTPVPIPPPPVNPPNGAEAVDQQSPPAVVGPYGQPAAPPTPMPAGSTSMPAASTGCDTDERFGWNLGAGWGFGDSIATGVTFGTISPSITPSPRFSLERRLGDTTWLAMTGTVSYGSFEEPVVSPAGSTAERRTLAINTTRVAALLGVRQVIARSIVDVSLSLAVRAAHESVGGDAPRGTEQLYAIVPGSSSDTLGVVGGLVVERQLIRALALRLAADIVAGSIGQVDKVVQSNGEQLRTTLSSGSVALGLSPSVQLQFYF